MGSAERVDHRSHAERGLDEQPTIHEGVAARAMEKKGVISERCEINRQIKAGNALLRELKKLVKNLTEAVSEAATSIGNKLTQLRENMIVFCYQLKHIALGRDKLSRKLNAVQPLLKQYTEVVRQIKQKTKSRKALLAERKNTSKLNLIKQHDLSRQSATLTEEIEELRSEKENLLLDLGCADDAGIKAVHNEVTAMEASLHKLDEQEAKYSDGFNGALQQYKQLQMQADEVDMQKVQSDASTAASTRLQHTYGKRFNAQMLRESQQEISKALGEDGQRSLREQLSRPSIRSNIRKAKEAEEAQL